MFDPDDEDGIDNDGNGYVDDFVGWDFINNDNNPIDGNGHGTHVAGIIGAKKYNGIGIHGISNNVELVPLKFLDDSAKPIGTLAHAILAIDYCIKNDIPLSNNSWSGEYSVLLDSIISEAAKANHLFIAGAGNDGENIDTHSSIWFNADNTLVVAATNAQDNLWVGSNFGTQTVDLVAPGVDIYSTLPNNTYGDKTGTSMAVPFVTGACAYYWGADTNKTYQEVKEAILGTVDVKEQLLGKVSSSGRLNMSNLCLSFCLYKDSLTLVSIYNSFQELGLELEWNLNQPVSTWKGVTLSESGCNVRELYLVNEGLSGPIPIEIVNLDSLVTINLTHNNFSGALPVAFTSLSKLKTLDLSYNNLYGCFPFEYKKFCETSVGAYFKDNLHLDNFDIFCQGMGFTCEEYLPGDSNNDGIVNHYDLLYWGLAYGTQGQERTNNISNYCLFQPEGLDWDAFIGTTNPINVKYADTNGDGLVDNLDFLKLEDIYSGICLTNDNEITDTSLNFDETSKQVKAISILEGEQNGTRIELYLQEPDGEPISTHGFASQMVLSGIETASLRLDIENSCLQPDKYLFKYNPTTKVLDIALTRIDGSDKICSDSIPVAKIVIANVIAIDDEMEINTIKNASKVTFDDQVETVIANDLHISIPTSSEVRATSETMKYWISTSHHYCDLSAFIEVYSISDTFAVTCVKITGDNRIDIPFKFADSIYSFMDLSAGIYEIILNGTEEIRDTFQIKDYCLVNNEMPLKEAPFIGNNVYQSKSDRFGNTNGVTLQVFPNPMQNEATIQYDLPITSSINLNIYNAQGKLQKVLYSNNYQQAGRHHFAFHANRLEKGFYFLELQTEQQIITKKILLR